MSVRTVLVFWASATASVILLGTLVATVRSHPGAWGAFLIGLTLVGLIATLCVAARIAFFAGRLKRLAKQL